jgi:serine/threonine protein kinase
VAIKILSRSTVTVNNETEFAEIVMKANNEVTLMVQAERKMIWKDCMVHIYGIIQGQMPRDLSSLFHLPENEVGVGIVMSYESGGSLESFLKLNKDLTIAFKVKLLSQIARNIAELHLLNIVHGDLKPANILLKDPTGQVVHLADFGLSKILSIDAVLGVSSLQQTHRMKGTPLYGAPEMLVNPFNTEFDESVAAASRKTDMYAFGILSWYVLTQTAPFSDVRTEAALCAKIHNGTRPSLESLPQDTPAAVGEMMVACWDSDRTVRKTATECAVLLFNQSHTLNGVVFDGYVCHDAEETSVRSLKVDICYHFNRCGLNVYLPLSNDDKTGRDTDSPQIVFCSSEFVTSAVGLSMWSQIQQRCTADNVFVIETESNASLSLSSENWSIVKEHLCSIQNFTQPDSNKMESETSDITSFDSLTSALHGVIDLLRRVKSSKFIKLEH